MRQVVVDLPPGPWVPVPYEGADDAWARATAQDLVDVPAEGSVDGGAVAVLTEQLREVARAATESGALACAALVPEGAAPEVLAVLTVLQVQCADDPAAVAAELGDLATVVPLPLGPAVRRHAVEPDEAGVLVESVEHVVPLGEGSGLLATASWTAVAAGDELVALADGAAAGLALR